MPSLVTIRPADARSVAFRWIVARLKADPDLARVVRTWQAWEGTGTDTADAAAESVTVRLTPVFEAEDVLCADGMKRTIRCPVLVRIDAMCPGSNVENAINLAGLIEETVLKIAPEVLNEGGISWAEPVNPAALAGDGVSSSGAFRLLVFVDRGEN
jgi:hypothetical protein